MKANESMRDDNVNPRDGRRGLVLITGMVLAGSLAFGTAALATSTDVVEPGKSDRGQTGNPPPEPGRVSDRAATKQLEHARELVKASKVIGVDLFDSKNHKVGEVKDLAINLNNGRIGYVVASIGDLTDAKLVAMPPETLRVFRNNDEVKLDVTQQLVRQLPALPEDNWLVTADPNMAEQMYQAMRIKPTEHALADAEGSYVKASELLGGEVVMTRQEDKPNIKDLALDLQDGYAPYVIVSVGGIAGIGDTLVAVPTSAFTRTSESDQVQLSVSEAQLKSAPELDQSNWVRTLANRDFGARLYSSYGATPYWERIDERTPKAVGGSQSPDTEILERSRPE